MDICLSRHHCRNHHNHQWKLDIIHIIWLIFEATFPQQQIYFFKKQEWIKRVN
jgi:hypothetical protein